MVYTFPKKKRKRGIKIGQVAKAMGTLGALAGAGLGVHSYRTRQAQAASRNRIHNDLDDAFMYRPLESPPVVQGRPRRVHRTSDGGRVMRLYPRPL